MKRLVLMLMTGMLAFPAVAVDFYISPDVPTDDPGGTPVIFLPWEIVRVDSITGAHSVVLSLPLGTAVDALHRRCDGQWLLSVEAPTQLPAAGPTFESSDVILHVPALGTYGLVFCGRPVGIPDGVDVDAAFVEPPGDDGDLILSFDVVVDLTTIGGGVYEPADLVRFTPTGIGGCAGWAPAPVPYFDASAPSVSTSVNVSGADERAGLTIPTFDVPLTPSPPAPTYLPGELVSWNGAVLASYYSNPAWPIDSRFDAFSFLPDPGEVPASPASQKIHLDKVAAVPVSIRITWSPSSSAGAEDYGIYEGTIASLRTGVYDHKAILCTDAGGDFQETFNPRAESSYYLVVAMNPNDEGSYGQDYVGNRIPPRIERPAGIPACRPTQALGCP
jgi:hypothetical protein